MVGGAAEPRLQAVAGPPTAERAAQLVAETLGSLVKSIS